MPLNKESKPSQTNLQNRICLCYNKGVGTPLIWVFVTITSYQKTALNYSLHKAKTAPERIMILIYIWWGYSCAKDLGSMKYSFITINPLGPREVVLVRLPFMGQIELFKSYSSGRIQRILYNYTKNVKNKCEMNAIPKPKCMK